MFSLSIFVFVFILHVSSEYLCDICLCDQMYVDCTSRNLVTIPIKNERLDTYDRWFLDLRGNRITARNFLDWMQRNDRIKIVIDIRNNSLCLTEDESSWRVSIISNFYLLDIDFFHLVPISCKLLAAKQLICSTNFRWFVSIFKRKKKDNFCWTTFLN